MFPILPEAATPAILILALGLLYPARREPGPFVTALLLVGLVYLVARYFSWRITETLYPGDGVTWMVLAIWVVFAIEVASWFDATVLFAQLSRRTNRSKEADHHEERLRWSQASDLPHVDVLIATYDEPLEVLERTIIGAMSIDWPEDRLHFHVLDDSKRPWLEVYCFEKGVEYLTRPDNTHAKAGNINAALKRTHSEFFLVLDADFVPQRNILYRMVGFFEDPEVGIVQVPHEFFNFDPLQTNLAMRNSLPSDQKMFFREIMRGRDGWDCAFCCGSNSLTRRKAMNEIGGAMPTGSITEDMLLTLAFLRRGYKTRYLCERLAVGLAPESLDAFFVQRSRWAQGALQILYLGEGPLGPGLTFAQRIMFLPTHWLTQALMQVTALILPVAYLLFGFIPMILEDISDLFFYQIPAVMASIMVLRRLAPDAYFAIPSTILATLQCFRFLPMLLKTLIKPHGHKFKVTPKGSNASGQTYDRFTLVTCLFLLWGTTMGFLSAIWSGVSGYETRQIFPIVSLWSVVNGLIIAGVLTVAFSRRVPRAEERFNIRTSASVKAMDSHTVPTETFDISMSGARIAGKMKCGDWLTLTLPNVPPLLAKVRWTRKGQSGIEFIHAREDVRDALIAAIYTDCDKTIPTEDKPGNMFIGLLYTIFWKPRTIAVSPQEDQTEASDTAVSWYQSEFETLREAADWDQDLQFDLKEYEANGTVGENGQLAS